MEEEPISHTLWVGTRSGLSILDLDNPEDVFINYLPDSEENILPYNELDGIVCDKSGIMWLGMMGGGVCSVNMNCLPFENGTLENLKQRLFSPSVRSMLIDHDGTLWMGIGTYGLVIQEDEKQSPVFYTDHSDFRGKGHFLHTINSMMERSSFSEIWFATWGNGVYVYDKKKEKDKIRHLFMTNTPWLPDNMVFSMLEDKAGNVWLGCRDGLAVYMADGKGVNLSDQKVDDEETSLRQFYYAIAETNDRSIWLGTNEGIIRIEGAVEFPDQQHSVLYSCENKRLPYGKIRCLYVDQRGDLWAGSDGGGLMKYDVSEDRFVWVSKEYNIPADGIFSIQGDNSGGIWLGTNAGLIHLVFSGKSPAVFSRIYTANDGLLNNAFIMNATAKGKDGKLYFGGHNGYNSFYPEKIREAEVDPPVVITDILVFNTSIVDFPEKERNGISPKSPDCTEQLVLKYDQNNFGIEFSALSYANPSANKYAYKLDGYDTEWQYTGASNRIANYSNLGAGFYQFHLKGSNGNGVWNDAERTLRIRILPPPWKTGWAYFLYWILILGGIFFGVVFSRKKIHRQQLCHLEALEQAKTEEMNHAKLQFFTNITHELLTPLTILSASLDEMKIQAPQLGGYYTVMSSNINRLIRLIQQILEFRKAESGNLKLKVSQGDIVEFIRKEIDAFRPLMKKKKMSLYMDCVQESIIGYFDPDKLDKIIYNLLSNASKYNKVGGNIQVTVAFGQSTDQLVISVKDDGEGIPEDMKKNLFMRFYEGDYRRFKTIGTGIGLSLTKDLVVLHGGTIRVESEVGLGSTFIISLPIARTLFTDEQVDENPAGPKADVMLVDASDEDIFIRQKTGHSILLVEDNEDLLTLMVKLLSREYNVYTAVNGVEAVKLIESKNQEIDLVVSDIMMPEMDGVELCKYIKTNFDICHVPVLLLTAKNKEEDRIEAYESGADGFITKPFNLSLLYARIRNLLMKKERMAHDFKRQLVFETKELDYTSMDEDFLKRAIDCVHQHLSEPDFDQQRFLTCMNTSKSTLYKKLKSLTGLNTSAFIRNIRLKAACSIIEEKQHVRISELAYAVGFNDPKYFSVCFRKEFGMLPTEYMEQYIGNSGSMGKEEL